MVYTDFLDHIKELHFRSDIKHINNGISVYLVSVNVSKNALGSLVRNRFSVYVRNKYPQSASETDENADNDTQINHFKPFQIL